MHASVPLLTCTGVALAAMSLCGCTKRIDQAAARAVVEKVEIATKEVNWGGVHYYLADDCVVHDTSPKPDGTMETTSKSCTESVEEGARVLSQAAYQGATHTYDYQIQDVRAEGDKAVAHLNSTVTISNRGHSLKTVSDQFETVQMRNGKLLITAIDEKATDLEIDGRTVYRTP